MSWLLIPLALIYLMLLYGFAAKSLVTWDLPRGTVGWLVGGFAAFGLAVWSAAWPFRETGNRWCGSITVSSIMRWSCRSSCWPSAWACGRRIRHHRKTLCADPADLWLGGIALYGILARPARLAVAPAAFAAMLIAGAIGPWGATSMSIRSQIGQLESMLTEAGILIDGQINPEEGVAGPKEVKRISSIVRYLRRGDRRDDLDAWLEDAGAKPAGGEDSEALLALMGLDYVEEWEDESYFSYSVSEAVTVDISGFDIAHNLNFGDDGPPKSASTAGRRAIRSPGTATCVRRRDRPPGKHGRFDLGALAEHLRPRST